MCVWSLLLILFPSPPNWIGMFHCYLVLRVGAWMKVFLSIAIPLSVFSLSCESAAKESLCGATSPFVDCSCLFLVGGQCDGVILEFPVFPVMPQVLGRSCFLSFRVGFFLAFLPCFLWQSNSASYLGENSLSFLQC